VGSLHRLETSSFAGSAGESFTPFFDPRLGRSSTPMEVYLRLMFLKFRYRLGYETLCREVADSITWRRFAGSRSTGGCRIRPC